MAQPPPHLPDPAPEAALSDEALSDSAALVFARRLNQLIDTLPDPRSGERRKPYSDNAIATAIGMSPTHMQRLRDESNPVDVRIGTVKRLAAFFGVPMTFFFDCQDGNAMSAELESLHALREVGVLDLSMRGVVEVAKLAEGLSSENLNTVKAVLNLARDKQGLPRRDQDD